jgi:hypothetical protein
MLDLRRRQFITLLDPGKEATTRGSSGVDDVRKQFRRRPRSRRKPKAFKETLERKNRWHDRAPDGIRRCAAADGGEVRS